MDNDLDLDLCCLTLNEVVFEVTLDGVYKHISEERIKQLDRLARFQPYGYTTAH